MRNKSLNNIWKVNFLSILCCFVWMGRTDLCAAKPPRQVDTVKLLRIAQWKERPHSIQLGYGMGYSLYHSYRTNKPLSRFMLDYAYDLPWKPIRTNFFVTGNVAYNGFPCNRKHYDVDQFHISAGIGFNIHLTDFLNLSFAYSPGFSYEEDLICDLNGTVNGRHHRYSNKKIIYAYRALFAIRLTGEVKNVRIGIGLEETHNLLFMIDPGYFLSLSVGYRF